MSDAEEIVPLDGLGFRFAEMDGAEGADAFAQA